MTGPKRSKQIPVSNRAAVAERSRGVCEGCGKRPVQDIHHRKYKSRGGTHDVSNLIAVCGWGNSSGCHGEAHTGAGVDLGWSVPSWARPELWPVLTPSGWVLFLDAPDVDGRLIQPITDATAALLMNGDTA